MRVTQSMISNNTLRNISSSYNKLSYLNNQLITQKKFSKPSDNPVAAMRAMGYRTDLNRIQQYQQNVGEVKNWVDTTGDSLDQSVKALQKIRELTVQVSNGTLEESQRSYIATEIEQLKQQIMNISDSQIGGKYIFGGTQTDKKPSDNYYATTGTIEIEVFEGIRLPANTSGANLFPGVVGASSSTSVSPSTEGANIVTGTYNGTEDKKISLKYENSKWQISEDGTNWTDMTGPKTIDGVTINVPTTTENSSYEINLNPERKGVISELIDTINGNGSKEEINSFLEKIDTQIDNFLKEQANIGARQNRVDLMEDRLGNQEVFATRILSDNEDADMERVIIDLTTQEAIHRAAMSSGARIIQPTLMDFLR
ncbi:flagellar hook-associated protein FlgL [Bacillus massiliigorillae]|uniref:flagellar hook-associated protein FlgL n=1 Tax=Bacillus massiliigorillae TaxID=1243664 RepID=UPI0003A9C97C|nr:flagellar hook-associated protein FlgL [Bacillus massiliigorillae]